MKTLVRLTPYLWPHSISLIVGGLCLLLAIPCQLFHPLVWKFIVDRVIGENKPEWLLPALAVMLGVNVAGTLLGAVRTFLLGRVGRRFIFDLRNDVYRKLQCQSLGYLHDRQTGDLIARTMNDVEALEEIVIRGVDNVFGNLLSFICVAVIIVSLHWIVGTITLTPLVIVAFLIWRFNATVKSIYRNIRDRMGDVTAKLHENLMGMMVIKAFDRDRHEIERFQTTNKRHLDESLKGVRARALYFPTIFSVGFLSNIIMVGLGGFFVLRGQFTVGGLVAYRGYWWQLFSPVQTLAEVNEMWQRAIAAADRIFELLDEPLAITDRPGATDLNQGEAMVQFERVSFHYHEDIPTLTNINCGVRPGHTLGIVGPSGAGKSTLVHLLLRLYDPTEGLITLGGRDLRDLTQTSVHRQFALVTQEAFLFNDTVRNNIRFGKLDATQMEIDGAARSANAHEFIEKLPKGYDTLVGERGVKLSGGQRQRLCIARAFVADPAILLLDEATAAVEPESEMLIQAALSRLMAGRTTIIISHRLSMVRDMDQILVIRDGRLIEQGTHDGLMARGGWYEKMYRLQMGA